MKAIEEYNITGETTGKVTLYPKNNKDIDYKKLIIEELKSYQYQKTEPTIWDKYEEFINNSIKDYKLNINLTKLNTTKKQFEEMKQSINFYTNDDFNKIIDEINKEYKKIIIQIEQNTNLQFGKDYILL